MLVEDYRVPLVGLELTSLIDYPNGELASVLFLGGCNFRCGYCHNPELVKVPITWLSIGKLLQKLKNRKKWISSLVISGGEPLMHSESFSIFSSTPRDLPINLTVRILQETASVLHNDAQYTPAVMGQYAQHS